MATDVPNSNNVYILNNAVIPGYSILSGTVVQKWAKRSVVGCVNSHPAARGSREAGFTQPRAHLLVQLCTVFLPCGPSKITFPDDDREEPSQSG